jgi:hypothetical protein
VILGETDKDVQDRLAWMKDHLIRYGTPENVAEARLSYAILNFAEVAYDRTALNLFTEKVVPALASAT